MHYDRIKKLECEQFRRLTGVKRAIFEKMIEILKEAKKEKKNRSGRKHSLCIEDRLLMALEYLREYRTYFHIAQSYGVSESSAYNTVKWIEDTLIKHPDFSSPGKKALLTREEGDIVLIDATESAIERPKKNRSIFILERRNVIR